MNDNENIDYSKALYDSMRRGINAIRELYIVQAKCKAECLSELSEFKHKLLQDRVNAQMKGIKDMESAKFVESFMKKDN